MAEDRIYLRELGHILDRAPHSIREWIRQDALPKKLMPKHEPDGRQRLYWSPSQIEGLKKFADERAQRQGWSNSAA